MTQNPIRIGLILGTALLAGCNSAPVRDPLFAPVRPEQPVAPPPSLATGAIYHEGPGTHLFEDLRARRVGDILTVVLSEKTDASKSASAASKKANSNSISNPTLFGINPSKTTSGGDTATLAMETGSEHDFSGEGSASQKNALTGDVVVTVTEVLSNGNLMVRGEKRVGINQGNEYIKLSGIVRPYDVGPDNKVQSTRIADPTIVYVGDGQSADATVMGWLSKFFISAIMPF